MYIDNPQPKIVIERKLNDYTREKEGLETLAGIFSSVISDSSAETFNINLF